MADLVDQQGQIVPVADDQASALVTSGQLGLRGDRPTNLIGGDGKIVNADPKDALELLHGGDYRLAADHEVAADLERQQYDTVGKAALATGAGALRGGTLGLSDVAIGELGGDDAKHELAKLQQHQPVASMLGEGGGVLGATLLTGGVGGAAAAEAGAGRSLLGLGARALTAPARAVVGGSEALGGALAKRLGAEGAASVLGRAGAQGAGQALGGATEGLLFGGAKAATDDYLNDHEITVERIAAGAGLGALLGGAFGGLTGTGGVLLEEGARKVASPVLGLLKNHEGLDGAIDKFIGERAFKSAMGGRNVRAVKDAKRYGGAEEIGHTLIKEMGPEQLARANVDDIAAFAERRTSELGEQLGRMADEIEASGSAVRPNGAELKNRIEREVISPLQKHFGQDADAIKREFGDFLEQLQPTQRGARALTPSRGSSSVDPASGSGLMGAATPDKVRTSGSGLMGEAFEPSAAVGGARVLKPAAGKGSAIESGLMGSTQAAPEMSFRDLLDWRKAIGKRIDWKVQDGTPKDVIEAKERLYRVVDDYWKETADKAADSVGRPGFRSELEATRKTYSQLEHVEKIAKQAVDRDVSNRFFSASDYGIGAALTGASAVMDGGLGSLVYGLAGGVLHRELRKRGSAMISGALYSLRNAPKALKDARAGEALVEKSVGGLLERVGSRAKQIGGGAKRTARATKKSTVPILGLNVAGGTGSVGAVIDRVHELQDPNSERRQRFAQNLAPIRVQQPQMAAAMNAHVQRTADFLAQAAQDVIKPPAAGDLWGHLRTPMVNKAAAETFLQVARAAENPSTVLEKISDGTVTKAEISTLKALSPRLYQRVVTQVIERLGEVDKLPTYQERIRLGIVLGAPTDPSLEPQNVGRLQQLARSGSQQSRQQASGPPPSARTPPKVADQYSTSTQSVLGVADVR